MQVIGIAPAIEATRRIAERSSRRVVCEWAERVLARHVRRTAELHVPVDNVKALKANAALDGLSVDVVEKIVASFKGGLPVYSPCKRAVADFMERALDTMDFMESLPSSDRRIRRIERLSWSDAEKLSEEWHASLARTRKIAGDLMKGVRKIAEFPDGSFVGELTTKDALATEGDQMGHCVGGYWNRVASGGTRIVSLRDPDGHPHVTVELAPLETVEVPGFGMVRLMSALRQGANPCMSSEAAWQAVQIRGKQNRPPVPKYADKVREWLESAGVPSRETGFETFPVGADSTVIYAVGGYEGRHRQLRFVPTVVTDRPEVAFEAVRDEALLAISQTPFDSGKRLVSLGVLDFLKAIAEDGVSEGHLSDLVDRYIAAIDAAIREQDLVVVDGHCGIDFSQILGSRMEEFIAASSAGREFKVNYRARLLDFLASVDADASVATSNSVLVTAGAAGHLSARVHLLPSLGLALLGNQRGHGLENRILTDLEPKFREIVDDMKKHQDVCHVVLPVVSGIAKGSIVQALFACGLGPQYATTAAQVQSGIKLAVRELNLNIKHALRQSASVGAHDAVGGMNVARNLLADGWENRIRDILTGQYGSEALIICTEPPRPSVAPKPAPAPVMKSYALPRR